MISSITNTNSSIYQVYQFHINHLYTDLWFQIIHTNNSLQKFEQFILTHK